MHLEFLGYTNHRFVELTKEMAEILVENYNKSEVLNRLPSSATIEKYKSDMDNNRWNQDLDITPVLIDKEMRVRGGLQRLIAFTKSTRDKMKFPVVYPASDEEITRQDTNRNRTAVNNNDMAMPKKLHNSIKELANLSVMTIHTSSKILCLADNHPGLMEKKGEWRAEFKTSGEKRAFTFPIETVVKSIEKYMPIFQEIDDNAFLPEGMKSDGQRNYTRFAPFVAAFAKAYATMDKKVWRKMVLLLTEQTNPFDNNVDQNRYLASEALIEIFDKKSEQNNPVKIEIDLRKALGCLAAVHKNVNIKDVVVETIGYETFLKKN